MIQPNFSPFPTLMTARLVLRQLKYEDEKEIYELRTNEEVNRFLDREKAQSIEDARKFINKILQGVFENKAILWAINLKGNDQLIGSVVCYNISIKDSRGEIGYELNPSYQGIGIMKEALEAVIQYGFDRLGFDIIEAWPTDNNLRSIQLLEKFNFKRDSDDPRLKEDHNKGMRLYLLRNKE